MSHEKLVELPDGVVTSLVYGKGCRNVNDITARLPEHCEITGRGQKGPIVVKGDSPSAVAACVQELKILIAVKKANFSLKFTEWKCIPVSSLPGSTKLKCVRVDQDYLNHSTFGPQLKENECLYSLEVCQVHIFHPENFSLKFSEWKCIPVSSCPDTAALECVRVDLDYPKHSTFGPQLKENECLYSLAVCQQEHRSKFGKIPKETMDNIVNVFLPSVSDALKGETSYVRMKARFGRILFRVDRQSELRKCPLSAVMDDGFLTDDAICKFLPKLKKRNGFKDNALYTMVPQLPVHNEKLCTLINKVTVLLIDVVFFDANGQCEYVVLKCIKEGGRFYELVEVMKKPQEIACDCISLECLHDVRITLNICTAEDVAFSKAVKPTADWIVNALREHEDGSITIVTRGPEFAVVQVRRSEKTNYLYKYFWDSYLLTETESKQCNVLSMEGKVPKHSYGHISIKFDDNIHKEVELFNPQWISNYSLLEQITMEEAFKKHFFDLHNCQERILLPKRPTGPDFVQELQSFTNCALHIASYPSSQS